MGHEMVEISGRTLMDWGFKPGPWFNRAIAAAQAVQAAGGDEAAMRAEVTRLVPPPPIPLGSGTPFHLNIRAEQPGDADNIAIVSEHMAELMRLPTVVAGAVMPDACPSDSRLGTIPVGGVIATENAIHPGMHSADICCSVAITIFDDADPTALLDAGMTVSHFGPGGRPRGDQWQPPAEIMDAMTGNPFLRDTISVSIEHFGTQGDGNHFFYVGRLASTGQVALVTHHGSRKPGALLYKAGMAVAEQVRQRICPAAAAHNAWIPFDSRDGQDYWSALQIIRAWTKASHFAIHDNVAAAIGARRADRFWNEHNFVFMRDDRFYHAKGATPAFRGFAADDSGLTLIPLNMAEPVLITRGADAPNGIGFAPHGAGRNMSRSAYLRENAGKTPQQMFDEQTAGIDARSFCGNPDASELPGAYKNAAMVRRQIDDFGLAAVVDTVEPIGCIMAGDWEKDTPWRKKREAKKAAALSPHPTS